MCQHPARAGPALPIATPSYQSCDGLKPHLQGLGAFWLSHLPIFMYLGQNTANFSLNPMSEYFHVRLDLYMKDNALGSLRHNEPFSLAHTELQRLFNYL